MVLLLTLINLFMAQQLSDIQEEHTRVDACNSEVAELLVLTNEYALHAEERAAQQWHVRHANIIKMLDGAAKPLNLQIHAKARLLDIVFSQLVELAKLPESGLLLRRKQLLLDNLLTNTRILSDTVQNWRAENEAAHLAVYQRFHDLSLFTPIFLLLILIFLTTLLRRRILAPLSKLHTAVTTVARGELTISSTNDTTDEFSELSRTFDAMAVDLVSDLRKEVAERKLAEEALRLSEQRFRDVIETSMDAIVQMNADGIILGCNREAACIFGWIRTELIGRNIFEVISIPEQLLLQKVEWLGQKLINQRTEVTGLHRDGHEFLVELSISSITIAGNIEFSAFLRDITHQKNSEAIIWKQANFDALTTLPNRHMFQQRLLHELNNAQRSKLPLAILLIDLDHFKEINDTLGHNIGDILLVEAARRILDCVRITDTVARVGGDEFVVILPDLEGTGSIERIAQSIARAIAEPFHLKEEMGYVSASIGIAVYPNDALSSEDLLKNADQAMYVAKKQGRNRHSYFTRALEEEALARLRVINDMRGALSAGQFMVYFQPIVNLATGHIHKAEALIRWRHPERGLISPAEFIPLAEESGLIFEIGDWVFYESMRWLKRWRKCYNPQLQISVNKSPVQFYKDGDEHAAWLAHLQEHELPGDCIAIEITEGLLMDANLQINGALITLHNAGIQVSIDDFGTGYSSLSYLKKFDIDYLKIDQSFIRDLVTDPNDLALSEAIVVMAHKLGIKVIAEGVETPEQQALLVAAGCDYAQGFLYSKAVPPEEFELILQQSQAR